MKNTPIYIKLLFAFLLSIVQSISTFSQTVPRTGLVAWYPFNGNANDESGNGNNGTNYGGALTQDRNLKNNSAYYFSSIGCSPHILANVNTSSINTSGKLTFSFWIYREGDGCASPRVFQFGDGSKEFDANAGHFVVGWGSGSRKVGFDHASVGINHPGVNLNQNLDDKRWYHITYTHDGSIAKFYLDGQLVNSYNSSGSPKLEQIFSIGRFNKPSYDAFNGRLDDIGIWNRVLTEAEIRSLVIPGPQIESIEARNQLIDLNWSKADDNSVKKYKIYRSTSSIPDDSNISAIATINDVNTTTYTDETGLSNGTTYYYRLKWVYEDGTLSDFGNELSATPANVPIPSNIKISNITGGIKLDWDANPGTGNKYQVYRGTVPTSGSRSLLRDTLTANTYSDEGITNSNAYYYWIRAKNSDGTFSEYSDVFTMSAIPYVNTDSSVEANLVFKFNTISTTDVTKLYVYKGTSTLPTTKYDSVALTTRYVDANNTLFDQDLYYRFTTGGSTLNESNYSNEIKTIAYSAPVLVFPSNNQTKSDTSFTFKWNKVNKATGYKLQYSLDQNFAQININEVDVTDSFYTKSALKQDTTYYWRVKVVTGSKTSNWSTKFKFTTRISPPIILSIKPGNKVDTLAWSVTSSTNLKKIRIYRDITENPSKLLDSVAGNSLSYIDTIGLKINQKYYYRLMAVNNQDVESEYGIQSNATPYNKYPIAVKLTNKSYNKVEEYNTIRTNYSFNGSTDPDGKIVSFKWYVNDVLVNSSDTIFINYYYQGTNTVKLLVEDNDGYKDSSSALVVLKSFEKKFNGGILGGITALSPNIIYAADSSYDPVNGASIYKLDRSGNTNFALAVTSKIFTTPSVSQDSSVFITSGSNLNGFNKSGAPLWPTIPLGGLSQVTPTVDSMHTRIYVGVANKNFFAIDYKTGKVVWNFQCDAPINASAVITGDRKLVIVSQAGTLYGFDIRGDSALTKATWTYTLGETIAKSAAVDDSSNLYFGTTGGKLIKLKLNRDGSVTKYWTTTLTADIETSPVLDASGYVYIGTKNGKFYKMSPKTGETIWEYAGTGSIKSTPALTDFGTIVFATTSGQIVALDTLGKVKWLHKEESPISANLLYIQNMVYAGTEAGNLVALYDNPNTNTVNTSLSKNDLKKQNQIHASLANMNENVTFIDLGLASQKNLSAPYETVESKTPVWGTFQGNYRRTGSKALECPEKPTINKTGTLTICSGENVELTTSALTNSTWVVDGQETTNGDGKLVAKSAGVYKRIARNDNGCKVYSEEVTIKVNEAPTKPSAVASSKTTVCEGETVQLNSSSSINNSWYRVGSGTVKGTLQGFSVDTTGSYFVKVTLSNGCTSNSDTLKVTVNAKPETPVIASTSADICSGDSTILSVKGGIKNQWYFNGVAIKDAILEKYNAKNAGLYSVKITNVSGCSNTSDALELSVKPTTEIPSIIPSGLPTFCQGNSILLTSSVNANNVWYKNGIKVGTGQFLSVSDSGFYKVTAMRTNMCMSQSDSLKVTVNKALTRPTITRNQAELVSSYTSGNQWYSNDGTAISGATEQKFRPTTSGYYTVKASIDGCTSANSEVYYYLSTAVVNFNDNQFLKLFPNPVRTTLSVEYYLQGVKYINMKFMDVQGRTIKEFVKTRSGDKLNLNGLSKGTYILLVTTNDGKIIFNQKILKD